MEEVKLSPEELKEAIDFGKLIGSGFFSSVFTYKGRLIKMDDTLYNLLKVNSPNFSKEVIAHHYRWDKKDFNDREQIEELSKKQPLIRPKVPEGIITIKDSDSSINNISPGIIIPYFEGYNSLRNISKTDYKKLLIFLRKIFDDIKNLADNEIAQEDLYHAIGNAKNPFKPVLYDYNIIQNGEDAQIIDMSGPLVKVGKDFKDASLMYKELAGLINTFYKANNIKPIYDEKENITEDNLADMISEFDKQTRMK